MPIKSSGLFVWIKQLQLDFASVYKYQRLKLFPWTDNLKQGEMKVSPISWAMPQWWTE